MVTTLSLCDYTRLEVLMSTLTGSRDAVAELARRKLASAIVMPSTDMAPDTVSAGRRVRFRVEGAPVREQQVVWHAASTQDADVVSCLEPLGLALLGLTPSQSVSYRDQSGKVVKVVVDDVIIEATATLDVVDTAQSRTKDVAVSRSPLLQHLRSSLSRWLQSRALAALEGLNDNVLADIGITRRDLGKVAARVLGEKSQ